VQDRRENMRRLKHLCELFNDNDKNVITTFISPFEESRKDIEKYLSKCYVVYVKCDIQVCETRDVKGLYKKFRKGEISNFTGFDSPYEEPKTPDIILDTTNNSLVDCVKKLDNFIQNIQK